MPDLEEILRAKAQRVDETHRLQPGRTALLVVDMQRDWKVIYPFEIDRQ